MSQKKPRTNAASTSGGSKAMASRSTVSGKHTRSSKVTITTSPLTGLPVIHGKVTITEGGKTKRVRDLHARVR